ncbi:HNH endonuclease signature motif containing protein [Streptomyces sp. NPDC005795]|uniref:HNH endonuclease signature motif containing protein n=1 Tax=Streptomyces sp. NPDC005795 TaxID=3154677 RepID=UPI0033EDB9CD
MSERHLYTRDRLVEAAEQCSDIDAVVAFFGTTPYDKLKRYLLDRFAHFGIDISHFQHRNSGTHPTRPAKSTLQEAVRRSRSVAELLRRLSLPDNRPQRTLLREWISEERLTTAHFLGQAHQHGRPGTKPAKPAAEVLVRHERKSRTKATLLRRALAEIGVPERCAACGTSPSWQGKRLTLEVDHINGDRGDDRAENLRFLCPNCHAVTPTWCRGNARQPAASEVPTTPVARPVPWQAASGGGAEVTQQT